MILVLRVSVSLWPVGDAIASRIVVATASSVVFVAAPRRHTSASVRPGVGLMNGRTASWPRRFSTGTASDGNSVTREPLATISTSVERLVAPYPLVAAPARAHSASA